MRSNNSFLTLIASFCLSAVAYNVAHADDIDVTKITKEVISARTALKALYQTSSNVKIITQADEADDGDGANIDMMNANWCLIHPDDVICQDATEEDEVEGC